MNWLKSCAAPIGAVLLGVLLAGCNTKPDKGSTRPENPTSPPAGGPKEQSGPAGGAGPKGK